MRLCVKYLDRHPKSKVLRYRRAFRPESLRDFIPGRPVQFSKSIRAMSITEPGAQARFNAAAAEYERIASAASLAAELHARASVVGITPITDDLIQFLIGTVKADHAEVAEEVRLTREPSARKYQRAATVGSEARDDLTWAKLVRGAGDYETMFREWRGEILSLGLAEGFALDPEDPLFERLVREYHDAVITVLERTLLQTAGEAVPALSRPLKPDVIPKVAKSFAAIAEAISTNEHVGFSGAMRQKIITALRLWRETNGEIAPAAIRKRHVTDFIELLQQRPAALPKDDRSANLRDLAAKYEGRTDVPRLSRTTITTHLLTLSTLWNHADDRGDFGGDEDVKLPNPFIGRKIAHTGPAAEPETISKAELEAVFSLPIFTRHERPSRGRGEASYWIPLLLLWTGARPEEVAQLRLEDFVEDGGGGRLLVRITNLGEHEHKGRMRLKTDKKATGRRTFPVPKQLIALGLRDYLAWLAAQGETVLFPLLRSKNERGNLFDSFGSWFSPMLKKEGVIPDGRRRPLRELRGNWTTYARKEGVARDAREFIQGHSTSGPGTSANEIYGDRSPLGFQIDLVSMGGLNLSNVQKWRKPE